MFSSVARAPRRRRRTQTHTLGSFISGDGDDDATTKENLPFGSKQFTYNCYVIDQVHYIIQTCLVIFNGYTGLGTYDQFFRISIIEPS